MNNIIASATTFLEYYPFQHDAHMIAWRRWMFTVRGIEVRANGRRYNRRGLPVDGGSL